VWKGDGSEGLSGAGGGTARSAAGWRKGRAGGGSRRAQHAGRAGRPAATARRTRRRPPSRSPPAPPRLTRRARPNPRAQQQPRQRAPPPPPGAALVCAAGASFSQAVFRWGSTAGRACSMTRAAAAPGAAVWVRRANSATAQRRRGTRAGARRSSVPALAAAPAAPRLAALLPCPARRGRRGGTRAVCVPRAASCQQHFCGGGGGTGCAAVARAGCRLLAGAAAGCVPPGRRGRPLRCPCGVRRGGLPCLRRPRLALSHHQPSPPPSVSVLLAVSQPYLLRSPQSFARTHSSYRSRAHVPPGPRRPGVADRAQSAESRAHAEAAAWPAGGRRRSVAEACSRSGEGGLGRCRRRLADMGEA
jgi:hypothetical protein